jgi:hypothetical protein
VIRVEDADRHVRVREQIGELDAALAEEVQAALGIDVFDRGCADTRVVARGKGARIVRAEESLDLGPQLSVVKVATQRVLDVPQLEPHAATTD